MTCLMCNVYKYICVSLVWNRYETGMKQVCQLEKKCNSHVLREGARRGPCQHPRKKINKHRITAKKSWENTDIAI